MSINHDVTPGSYLRLPNNSHSASTLAYDETTHRVIEKMESTLDTRLYSPLSDDFVVPTNKQVGATQRNDAGM